MITGSGVGIGGAGLGEGNLVSGGDLGGIWLNSSPTSAIISGNLIGTDITGALPLGNAGTGIVDNATSTRIGGTTPGAGNVISANTSTGIQIMAAADATTVQGNKIGVDSSGLLPLGNGGAGILVSGTTRTIGGTSAAAANTIAHNGADNVQIAGTADDVAILRNSIHASGTGASELGIDLGPSGVTPNDPGDADTGANDLLNFPEVTSATYAAGTVTVDFDLDVPAGDYRIEVFTNPTSTDPTGYGEGEQWQNAVTVTHTGSGAEAFQLTYSGSAGDEITLTTTEESAGPVYGSTSEFSAVTTVVPATLVVNSTADTGDATPGDGDCDTGALNSQGATECTLRAAIEEANAYPGTGAIEFAIATTEAGYSAAPVAFTITPNPDLPYLTDPVSLDATTQPEYLTEGRPVIALDGNGVAGSTGALVLRTDDSTIRGFVVHDFVDEGLEIDGSTGFGDNNTITDNWVGVDPAETPDGVGDTGILVTVGAADNTVARNVVVDSTGSGIVIRNSGTDGNRVMENLVGVGPDGTTAIGNGSHGVEIYDQPAGNLIGSDVGFGANTIANNGGDGVYVATDGGAGNSILGNAIHANGGLGIDLGSDGVDANDPGDVDGPGPNDYLNYPVITSATESGGTVTVTFDLDVGAGDHRVEFFVNPSGADPSGNGEGESFDSAVVVTTGTGHSHTFAGSVGDVISATATEQGVGPVYGSTSEFSNAFTVTAANSLPTAVLGGPYSIAEGEDLVLDGSGSSDPDADPLTYAWDLDGDSFFDDETGVNPTIPWLTLVGLGVDDDGSFPVGLQVDDSVSGTHEVTGTFTVTNTAPTLSTTGAATTVSGAVYTLTLGVSDPGADTVTGWTIDWGDGTVDTIAGNPPTVTHPYANEGYTNSILASAVDEDGTWHQNRLLVTSTGTDSLNRFEATTGTFFDVIGTAGDGLSSPRPVVIGPDGAAYVASATSADVRRFDPIGGGYLSTFVAAGAGGLTEPAGLAFGLDGFLYVADRADGDVVRFDAGGVPAGTFIAAGAGGLVQPSGLAFGPGDDLYVTSAGTDEVLRFDGDTGAFVETFIGVAGGLDDPRGLLFGPDGDLHVTSFATLRGAPFRRRHRRLRARVGHRRRTRRPDRRHPRP